MLDYLAEEVLRQQSPSVQTFLLHTSILSRMTASLCNAVTGQTDGLETLEALEQSNLFIVPLDDERRWYRYHHLFAEVLRAFLQREIGKEGLDSLHIAAAEWYEANGEVNEAFKHTVTTRDFERAVRLIEENWLRVGHSGEMHTILQWLEAMPEDVIRAWPLLGLAYAWALWLTVQMEGVEPRLDAADEGWDQEEAAGVVDPARGRWRAGGVALRLQLARHRGQLKEAKDFAQQTLTLASQDDALLRGYGHLGLAHTYREFGQYAESFSAYSKGISLMRDASNPSSANLATFYACRILCIQGRLEDAVDMVQEAIRLSEAQGMAESPACGILHVALAGLLCEKSQLQLAEDHLVKGLEMSRFGGHHDYVRNAGIVLARLRWAQRDVAGALEAIHDAEQITPREEMPLPYAELAAYKARVWIVQGNLADAARWVETAFSRPGEDCGYTRRMEALTCARVWFAQGKLERALKQLDTCQQMTRERGARGWAIEIGILKSLVHGAQYRLPDDLVDLGQALVQAESEGYIQLFVDEGASMAALLTQFLAVQERDVPTDQWVISQAYARRVLDVIVGPLDNVQQEASLLSRAMIEPLTEREEEVWFEGLIIQCHPDGTTTLSGPIRDQLRCRVCWSK